MGTIHNPTHDDLGFPNADGVEVPIKAGASVEVDAATFKELEGHPILTAVKKAAKKAAADASAPASTPDESAPAGETKEN